MIELCAESLETFVFNFRQSVLVQNRDQRSVIGPDFEVFERKTVDEWRAFLCGPADGKQLELDHRVSAFSFGEESRSGLNGLPNSVDFLLENESDSVQS